MKNTILLIIVVFLSVFYKDIRSTIKSASFFSPTIKVKNIEDDKVQTKKIEDYVISVVAAEMPASFEIEALKAQAVAARTFAYFKMNQNNQDYDVTNDTDSQASITIDQMHEKWQDKFDYYYSKVRNAVEFTKDEVIVYNGEIISSYYFAMSSGMTENSISVFNEQKDYLISVNANEDTSLEKYAVETVVAKNDFCLKLGISACDLNNIKIEYDDSKYVKTMQVGNNTFNGIQIRKIFGLRSAAFDITDAGSDLIIRTYGYGHGVGMSQYGANNMAKNGNSYKDIIGHYYTGVEIKKITSIK